MNGRYVLDGKVPRRVEDAKEWAQTWEVTSVARDTIGKILISTVFLGFDHNFGSEPLLFETMIFGLQSEDYCWRCSTWEQAEAQHRRAVNMVMVMVDANSPDILVGLLALAMSAIGIVMGVVIGGVQGLVVVVLVLVIVGILVPPSLRWTR